jgi:hypothetical protein
MSTIARRKKKSKIKQKKSYPPIPYSLNKENFLQRIKEDPWCICTDPKIKKKVKILQVLYRSNSREIAKIAGDILRKAGLSAFISKEARKRRADTTEMLYLKNNRDAFVEIIKTLESEIIPFLKSYYKTHSKGLEEKKKDIRRAFEHIIQKYRLQDFIDPNYHTDEKCSERFSLSDAVLKELTEGERDSHSTKMAISLFAFIMKLPYTTLRGLFFPRTYLQNKPISK